ncbi:hypothetical protein B4080_2130 [Bacillus cereus]|nr:hypothetical protein B4080_2130 [Bacillus cereus]
MLRVFVHNKVYASPLNPQFHEYLISLLVLSYFSSFLAWIDFSIHVTNPLTPSSPHLPFQNKKDTYS